VLWLCAAALFVLAMFLPFVDHNVDAGLHIPNFTGLYMLMLLLGHPHGNLGIGLFFWKAEPLAFWILSPFLLNVRLRGLVGVCFRSLSLLNLWGCGTFAYLYFTAPSTAPSWDINIAKFPGTSLLSLAGALMCILCFCGPPSSKHLPGFGGHGFPVVTSEQKTEANAKAYNEKDKTGE